MIGPDGVALQAAVSLSCGCEDSAAFRAGAGVVNVGHVNGEGVAGRRLSRVFSLDIG
jgi:hypothetical protein